MAKRGRPKKTGLNKPVKTSVSIPLGYQKKLQELAENENESVNSIIRRLIKNYFSLPDSD